jgi:hypothetical protein
MFTTFNLSKCASKVWIAKREQKSRKHTTAGIR